VTETTQTDSRARKGGGLSSMLLPELKALAGQLGISGASGMRKADLVSAISARQVGGPGSARLQVRFAPAWLSVLPFVWGDYWVIDLDERYELVAISEPKRDYLWILSRSPQVDPARYQALLARLAAMGLEVGRLEKTPQRGS